MQREVHGWHPAAASGELQQLLFLHFVIPFFGLLSRHVKRNRKALAFWACWILCVVYMDMYWLVMPEYSKKVNVWDKLPFQLTDVLCFVGIGGVLIWNGLRGAPVEGAFSHIPWIGVVSVIGSVVFFGLTIRGIGLAPAVALVVFATASASRYARWTSSLLLAVGMAAACTALFVYALGLPLPVFGPWLSIDHWSPAATVPAQ